MIWVDASWYRKCTPQKWTIHKPNYMIVIIYGVVIITPEGLMVGLKLG